MKKVLWRRNCSCAARRKLETEVSRLKTELVVEKAKAMEDKNAEIIDARMLIQAEQRTDSMNSKLKKLRRKRSFACRSKVAKSADETMKVQHTNALKTTLNTIESMQAKLAKGRSNTLMRIVEAKKG